MAPTCNFSNREILPPCGWLRGRITIERRRRESERRRREAQLGGPGACSPGKFLELEALRCILAVSEHTSGLFKA